MALFLRFLRACIVFGTILASYLFMLGLDRAFGEKEWIRRRWKSVHDENARRLYRGIIKLRGVFIKMGQVLSIMGSFLPRAYARELEALQDQVPPTRTRDIERSI